MSITIGIDFGTTRSAVVKYNPEEALIEKAGVDPILAAMRNPDDAKVIGIFVQPGDYFIYRLIKRSLF